MVHQGCGGATAEASRGRPCRGPANPRLPGQPEQSAARAIPVRATECGGGQMKANADQAVANRRESRSVISAIAFVIQAGGSITSPREMAKYPETKTSASATYWMAS